MERILPSQCVDLIYLDPPFNSKQNYNLMYKNMTGKPVPEQAEAFCDTWEMDAEKIEIAKNMPMLMREHGIDDYYAQFWDIWVKALARTQPHLLAYLIYMVQRLLFMKVVLKPNGSIYLHCDPTASHYIKVMMDGIFGHANFRSEIIWKRTSSHNSAKRWGPVHDVILYYTKSHKYTWNRISQPYDEKYIEAFYKYKDQKGRFRLGDLTGAGTRTGDSGKAWRGVNPTDSGRHWAVPAVPGLSKQEIQKLTVQERLDLLDEKGLIYFPPKGSVPQFRRYLEPERGVAAQDIITDIDPISPHASERLGYPTQKPITLLDRIVRASSNPGDIVFDPFCGCGTTIYAAEKAGRKWIGCDIAILSIQLITDVLIDKYQLTKGQHFTVDGIPVSVEQAKDLWSRDKHQFQHWVVEKVGGFPTKKKSSDYGVDGRVYFDTKNGLKDMVISVKGGETVKPADVREIRGVLEREQSSEIAGFLSIKPPTKAMKDEAAAAGFYEYMGINYQRIQFLTVQQILEEKRLFHTPSVVGSRVKTNQLSFPFQ
ncbi:MAG TPA: site-specific DNA-methyltransferase [Pyrinomonadaceae bacterium]